MMTANLTLMLNRLWYNINKFQTSLRLIRVGINNKTMYELKYS